MLISTHVSVGALIGQALSRRGPGGGGVRPTAAGIVRAAAVGVVSHFACDMLPHWGLQGGGEVRGRDFLEVAVPDGLFGLGLLTAIVWRTPPRSRCIVAAAALGACLPDADKVGEFAVGRSPYPARLDRWHGSIQRESPSRLRGDIVKAAALAVLALSAR